MWPFTPNSIGNPDDEIINIDLNKLDASDQVKDAICILVVQTTGRKLNGSRIIRVRRKFLNDYPSIKELVIENI